MFPCGAHSHRTAPSHTVEEERQEMKWNGLTCFHGASTEKWKRQMLSQKELKFRSPIVSITVSVKKHQDHFVLCLFILTLAAPLFISPVTIANRNGTKANCFITTSCTQTCSTQSTGDQKWWKVWSQLAKEGNTILKTNMNERVLQSPAHHWLGKGNTPTVCILSLWLIYPQGRNMGIFTLPLDLGEAIAEREKTAVAWQHKPPRSYRTECDSYMLCCGHLSKYSAGQSLPHGMPSVPKNSAACGVRFMLGVISLTAEKGTMEQHFFPGATLQCLGTKKWQRAGRSG